VGIFDKIRQLFSSTPRHKYQKATRKYDGARRNPLNQDWLTSGTSADAEIYTSLRTLRNRSRDLIRNDDYARGLQRAFVNNIVLTGIKLQSQVSKIRGEGFDEKTNDAIEKSWVKWSKNCDASGYGSLALLQQLIIKSFFESGEVFIRKIKSSSDDSAIPFSLEVIEADQIADDQIARNWVGNKTQNQVKMGIELDRWNRPVAYYVYSDHPGDYGFRNVASSGRYITRVPAEEIIHLFLKERPGQTRGVPWLFSSINRLRNLSEYEKSEQIAARASANIAALITTEDADLLNEPEVEEVGEGEELEIVETVKANEALEPGSLMYLAPGEKVNSFDPSRPNSALPEFNAHMLRGAAAGNGVTYEAISKDYSRSNYSSSRLSSLDARDLWRVLQAWFIEKFINPVYEEWLDMAVLAGELNLTNYEINREHYQAAKWISRGWEWVDPDKEVKAIERAIRLGLTSRIQQAAKNGYDFEEICKDLAREKEIAEKYGIELTVSDGKENEPSIVKVESE